MKQLLNLDVGKQPKSKEDHYPREDGEPYSIKMTVGNYVFYGLSLFGKYEAQQVTLNKVADKLKEHGVKVEII